MVTNSQRGEVTTIVLLALLVLGGAFAMFRPKATHGDSRRAEASREATQQVVQAVDSVDAATKQRSAEAAASVTQIAAANATAPESKEKQFIAKESDVALSKLEAPDPTALRLAYERRLAVMEGRIAESNRLYSEAFVRADQLSADLVKATTDRNQAIAEREAIDRELAEVAAARLAAEKQRARWMIAVAVVGVFWLWAKLTHFSPMQIASTVRDIRAGVEPIQALDTPANRLQQKLVNLFSKL